MRVRSSREVQPYRELLPGNDVIIARSVLLFALGPWRRVHLQEGVQR